MKTKSTGFVVKDSPLPIAVLDRNLDVLISSKAVSALFDKPKTFRLKTLGEIFGEVPEGFKESANRGSRHIETLPIISKSGRTRWIRTSLYPAGDLSETFQVYFDDVTDGKTQYELATQAKQIARIGSWRVDLIKNTVSWSNLTKEIHEVPEDFVPDLEKGINFYKKGIHRDKIVEAVSECIESGNPFDLELIIVTAKGNEKWVRAIGEAEISNGKIIGFKGVFQDIDAVKREHLRNELMDKRMRIAIESAQIGIWDWDVVKNDLVWDNNMFALFEIDPNKFQHAYEAWESSLHPDDKEKAAYEVELALAGKKDFDTEFRIVKENGSVAHIQGRAQVLRDEKGTPLRMVGINSDITRMRRKDERLRNLLELTEKQNQKLLNFAHIVSHNLRSNSTNISMLSGMLLSNVAAKEKERFLKMIHTSSEKLEDTLYQLNEIIKIQQMGHRDFQKMAVLPILESVCESINAIIKESGTQIKIKIPKSLQVWGIKPYLTSIFLNLLSNSIKYRIPGEEPRIEIEAKNLGNQTVLAFHDNGLGIDLKKHGKNLFGMYKTFHNNKDAKGMGLYMTKNQMEAMNGKIEVKSKPGMGSTFYLYFKNEQ